MAFLLYSMTACSTKYFWLIIAMCCCGERITGSGLSVSCWLALACMFSENGDALQPFDRLDLNTCFAVSLRKNVQALFTARGPALWPKQCYVRIGIC